MGISFLTREVRSSGRYEEMNFYRINSRQEFSSYDAAGIEVELGKELDVRIVGASRIWKQELAEYLGMPPRSPGRQGDFHESAGSYFLTDHALPTFEEAARGRVLKRATKVQGRSGEFWQVWVVNFVDCLDLAGTQASPPGGFYKGKIGVIRKPVFDESRWDGSGLFVVPQDPSSCLFCTERFLEAWRSSGLVGIQFSKQFMDPHPIKC
jgi:hypothetical protein